MFNWARFPSNQSSTLPFTTILLWAGLYCAGLPGSPDSTTICRDLLGSRDSTLAVGYVWLEVLLILSEVDDHPPTRMLSFASWYHYHPCHLLHQ